MNGQGVRVISGVATDLVVHSGEEEFVRSAGQQAVGAAALAAGGWRLASLPERRQGRQSRLPLRAIRLSSSRARWMGR